MPADPARLYLITPSSFDPEAFAAALPAVLAAGDVACLRLRLADADAETWRRAATSLRDVCHGGGQETALLVEDAWRLAADEGLDGVHLSGAGADLKAARAALGEEGVVGVAAGASRHQGLIAGERGADYVAFGPVASDAALKPEAVADRDLFDWWQCMIELPVVAEGGIDLENATALADVADFIALGPQIWGAEDGPAAAVARYQAAITAGASGDASSP